MKGVVTKRHPASGRRRCSGAEVVSGAEEAMIWNSVNARSCEVFQLGARFRRQGTQVAHTALENADDFVGSRRIGFVSFFGLDGLGPLVLDDFRLDGSAIAIGAELTGRAVVRAFGV